MDEYTTHAKRQKEEIETIKPRTFEIKLSDADVVRLYEKAYSNAITPEELIADYLGDLLCGSYSHGSDERRLANEYFERCCYEFNTRNFTQWAIEEGEAEYIREILEILEENKEDLQDEEESEQILFLKGEIEEREEDLKQVYELYTNYKSKQNETPQPMEEGLAELKAYYSELENMVAEGRKQ